MLTGVLEEGFEFWREDGSSRLDKKTGAIIFISGELFSDESDLNLFEEADEREAARQILILTGEFESTETIDEARFIELVPPFPSEKFRWMEEFTAFHVQNENVQNKLINALRGRKPFRKFKDVLLYQREFEQKWFDFAARKIREFIEEWAESEQIEIKFNDAGNIRTIFISQGFAFRDCSAIRNGSDFAGIDRFDLARGFRTRAQGGFVFDAASELRKLFFIGSLPLHECFRTDFRQ